MKNYLASIAVLVLATLAAGHACADTELAPAGILNKMSMSLRGTSPFMNEYQELAVAVSKGNGDQFLQAKKSQYLASSLFVEKMRIRLDDLFRLDSYNGLPLVSDNNMGSGTNADATSIDHLFSQIVSENESWDQLLNKKKYSTYTVTNGSNIADDLNFYSFLDPKYSTAPTPMSSSSDGKYSKTEINFSDDDLRVAGALTTTRFFNRYGTTALNKNRRRAAAVFRIFLCDSMTAAVPDPSQDMGAIYDLQFPKSSATIGPVDLAVASKLNDGIHGSQKDCASCHYKLDPMGQLFRGSQFYPSAFAWPGSLTFKNSQQKLVDVPVAGLGDLGKAVTSQPDYVTCQVGYFWNWFIGKDIQRSTQVQSELENKFNELGRRPKDFIAYLLDRPEFKSRSTGDPMKTLSRKVSDIFARCQSCHDGKLNDDTGAALLNLTEWPLGKNSSNKDSNYWLERIQKKIGLADGGRTHTMPPADANWSLSREELVQIQKWIDAGAPDTNGQQQVTK